METNLFSTEFFNCLISSETSNRFSLSEYFNNTFRRDYAFCSQLPHILSKSNVSVTSPFSYESAGLNAFCFIFTTKGAGRLFYENTTGINAAYELTKGTLAFIDCRKNHKLICQHNIWEYTICFLNCEVTKCYHDMLSKSGDCIFNISILPDVMVLWELLLKSDKDDEIHGIIRAEHLVSLFTRLYTSQIFAISGSYHIPLYIVDMKHCFDNAYSDSYTLDEMAARYDVNKFRLCREFAKYYDNTPLQYLNHVRIEKAKELLLDTDEKINIIGQMVGIENTNHFIKLFKEKTGVTPLNYRRNTPIL